MNPAINSSQLRALVAQVEDATTGGNGIDPEKLRPYEFRKHRSEFLDDLQSLQLIHDQLAERLSERLSQHVGRTIGVIGLPIEQSSFSSALAIPAEPAFAVAVCAQALPAPLLLRISHDIVFPMIDQLLGGKGDAPVPSRPMTRIEQNLCHGIAEQIIQQLECAWSRIVPLELRLEASLSMTDIADDEQQAFLGGFEVHCGSHLGHANIVIPAGAIESLRSAMASQRYFSQSVSAHRRQAEQDLKRSVAAAAVELRIALPETQIQAGDLLAMQVGDLLTTGHSIDVEASIQIENAEKLAGQPVQFAGRKALLVTRGIEPEVRP